MWERLGEGAPPRGELRRAVIALWVVAVVGTASFLAYEASAPVDLPVYPVPLVFLALIVATAALWR